MKALPKLQLNQNNLAPNLHNKSLPLMAKLNRTSTSH